MKLLGQRSVRMNTAAMLYYGEKTQGKDERSEHSNIAELSYTALPIENVVLGLNGFVSKSRLIDWDNHRNLTVPVGDLSLWGLELEAEYSGAFGRVGGSYSFVDQLDWQLARGVRGSSVSYADYHVPLEDLGTTIEGRGNALANWPRHALKLQTLLRPWRGLTVEADGRAFWDFAGEQDGLDALQRAVAGTSEEAATSATIARLDQLGVFTLDVRVDLSVAYQLAEGLVLRVFSQNLLGYGGNKRYAYDSGFNRPAPHKVRYVEEPRTFGASVSLEI